MNVGEQQQLREWADRLCEVEDPERRAMGRAISMLLDRIDELERELGQAATPEPRPAPEWLELPPESEPELEPELEPVLADRDESEPAPDDTAQLTLRDRLRQAGDVLRGDRA
jgi:hypothetical protein